MVVYLETTIDTLVRRTKAAKTRPLLMNDDPRAVLERMMVVRRPLYEDDRRSAHRDDGAPSARRRGRHSSNDSSSALQSRALLENLRRVETIVVALGERSYPIHIGPDLLDEPALYGSAAKQVLIVTNDVVAPLYLAARAGGLARPRARNRGRARR